MLELQHKLPMGFIITLDIFPLTKDYAPKFAHWHIY